MCIYEEGGDTGKKESSFVAKWAKKDLKKEVFRGETDGLGKGSMLDGEKEWRETSSQGEEAEK